MTRGTLLSIAILLLTAGATAEETSTDSPEVATVQDDSDTTTEESVTESPEDVVLEAADFSFDSNTISITLNHLESGEVQLECSYSDTVDSGNTLGGRFSQES